MSLPVNEHQTLMQRLLTAVTTIRSEEFHATIVTQSFCDVSSLLPDCCIHLLSSPSALDLQWHREKDICYSQRMEVAIYHCKLVFSCQLITWTYKILFTFIFSMISCERYSFLFKDLKTVSNTGTGIKKMYVLGSFDAMSSTMFLHSFLSNFHILAVPSLLPLRNRFSLFA